MERDPAILISRLYGSVYSEWRHSPTQCVFLQPFLIRKLGVSLGRRAYGHQPVDKVEGHWKLPSSWAAGRHVSKGPFEPSQVSMDLLCMSWWKMWLAGAERAFMAFQGSNNCSFRPTMGGPCFYALKEWLFLVGWHSGLKTRKRGPEHLPSTC